VNHDNVQIVSGMRQPHDTGQVVKQMTGPDPAPMIRRQTLADGEVEFHSLNRRYRVEFERPKQQMDLATGEAIQEGPRFLQFDNYRCVTSNPTLIHQAMGCENIPGAMECAEHGKKCAAKCTKQRCHLGHVDPRNITRKYFTRHGSYGIKMYFWDAAEMDKILKVAAKERLKEDAKRMIESLPEEEVPEFLAAIGVEAPKLPEKHASK
jgi:hypothetical protein